MTTWPPPPPLVTLAYLREQWGPIYAITSAHGTLTARPRAGGAPLTAASTDELLSLIRRTCQPPASDRAST